MSLQKMNEEVLHTSQEKDQLLHLNDKVFLKHMHR